MKYFTLFLLILGVFTLAITIGSVNIPLGDFFNVLIRSENVSRVYSVIVWELRMPRVITAFLVGAALSVSGAVMQSVLRNPLASSFTLGVSSGASFGAAMVIFIGISSLFMLPFFGFIFSIGTIVLVVIFSKSIDGRMENNTIILVGMVLSLFINSIVTLMMALQREYMQRLIFWQMGSFADRNWTTVFILSPIIIIGCLFIFKYSRELDIMTFGEEQAQLMGVNLSRVKWILLLLSAALTGSAIAFVGIIGFVDLVSPHIVRRVFGSNHRIVIPLSAVVGGIFMILCDLIARTVVPPGELPVGVVSALIGAPFFAYVFFNKRKIV